MRHRRTGILLAWTSALLCLMSLVMWGRGRWVRDNLDLRTPYHVTSLMSYDGKLQLSLTVLDFTQPQWMNPQDAPAPKPGWSWHLDHGNLDTAFFISPLIRDFIGPPQTTLAWSVYVWWWPIVLALAIFPAIKLIQFARARRPMPAGHCARCGYDLRATPDRCPECGAVRLEKQNSQP